MAGLLAGRVAVITGGASPRGIGFATGRLFAAEGARVAILDLDAEAAREAAGRIGPDHRGYACVFLASDLSAYVHGATLDVNGGLHIH